MNTRQKVKLPSKNAKPPHAAAHRSAVIAPEQTQALVSRLRRAEGQVRAVVRLIEESHDCDVVAQQLAAARKALDKSFYALVGCAVEHGQIAPADVSSLLAKYA